MLRYEKIPWATYGRLESQAELNQKSQEQKERLSALNTRPKFSFLIDSHSTESDALLLTLESLMHQSYPDWEAWVWATSLPNTVSDSRIKRVPISGPISFEDRLKQSSTGDWYVTGLGGDVFHPGFLFEVASQINRNSSAHLFYPQEILLEKKGNAAHPVFFNKSQDSTFTLEHFNYIGRCFAFRKDFVERLSLNSMESEWDFLKKIRPFAGAFELILGYWYYRGPESRLLFKENPPPKPHFPAKSLTAIICFKDKVEMTLSCLESLLQRKSEIPLKVVLVDNNSSQVSREKIQRATQKYPDVQFVSYPHPFNFGQMNNWAVKNFAFSEILLFLNNDVLLSENVHLDTWAAWASQSETGTVGICLKFPNDEIQHAGIKASFGDSSHLVRVGNSHKKDALTFVGREVFANTFAACMVRRSIFLEQNGLPSVEMANGFGDCFFNLSLRRKGLKNLYLGYFSATHAESSSRGHSYEYWEEVLLEAEFAKELGEMVRADLSLLSEPLGSHALKNLVLDWLKGVFRSYSGLQKIKPVLKKGLHTLWPSQAHAKI